MKHLFENPFKREEKKPLILDGAIGSLLQQRGFTPDNNIWMTQANKSLPDEIIKIHREYIKAGADIITTNTFRTNPSALEKFGISDPAPLVKEAVDLSMKAVGNLDIYIAGSNAPAEDCYQRERTLSYKELKINHISHIDLLRNNNVNFILNETQSHFDEIEIICNYCFNNKIPYVISLFIDEGLKLLSGESVNEVINFIWEHDPLAIGYNCITKEVLEPLVYNIEKNINWGFYLNCGGGKYSDSIIKCAVTPEDYVENIKSYLNHNPSFIGACCGSIPEHIRAIKEYFNEQNN